MKHLKTLAAFAITALTLLACKKETSILPESETTISEELATSASRNGSNEEGFARGEGKHVYTLSNQVSGNAVLDYYRNSNGTLTFNASYPTGGTGTCGGLGNQGAVIITDDEEEELLLAVNPGSNTISSFKIKENGLQLKSTVSSGGIRPVSITQHQNIVYVLNAGGTGNIAGFRLGNNDKLTAIANSTRPLSSATAGAAQVSFVNEGKVVVVTEKATNKIITYTINEWGVPGAMHTITSANPTPFGFDAGHNGNIFVSEAVGGAPGASTLSSYRVYNNGVITLTDGPVGAGQSAACWVVITGNGKYAFTTNTASNNISNYNVNRQNGDISINTAIAATTGMGPIDAALSNNSKYLYILNAVSHTIGAYGVANNGSLSSVQTLPGIPVGATGLAAR
jgi:6-phosphogluconolactonase